MTFIDRILKVKTCNVTCFVHACKSVCSSLIRTTRSKQLLTLEGKKGTREETMVESLKD